MSTVARRRSRPRLRRRLRPRPRSRSRVRLRIPRISPVVASIIAGIVIVLVAGWFWFKDSSLVAVRQVTVAGVSGPHASEIRGALRASALDMTTLDVDMAQLRSVVQPYRDVESISVSTSFPHGIVIHVIEQVPLAVIIAGDRRVAVSGAGLLLRAPTRSDGPLPTLPVSLPRGAARITAAGPLAALRVLAAAPWPMIARIASVTGDGGSAVAVRLRSGPSLLFGPPTQLAAKWAAAVAVLADSGSAGATYIDLGDPSRPAAGAPSSSGTATTAGAATTSGAATAGTTTTAATGTSGAASAAGAPTGTSGTAGAAVTGSSGAG